MALVGHVCSGPFAAFSRASISKVSEVEAAKGSAWFTDTEHNVFLDSGDDLFPQEHVRNRFEDEMLDNFLLFSQAIAHHRGFTCL